jgi:hypothetical protein
MCLVGLVGGCTSSTGASAGDGGASCQGAPPAVQDTNYSACSMCTASSATKCEPGTPIEACCTWLGSPSNELARGVGLHRYSSNDPTVNLGCLANPGTLGAPMNVTLTGFVWLFAKGLDSKGVKVDVFKANTDGSYVMPAIGSYTTQATDMADPVGQMAASWNTNCQPDGCQFRQYTIKNVPTETPLIIKTSDALGAGQWADLYDYNVYFSNASVQNMGVSYNASAVAATDIGLVLETAGGYMEDPSKGLLAGEVHDCGDVRLSGAIVGADQVLPTPGIVYFNSDEGNPLPDPHNTVGQGTSVLGLWGAFNLNVGVPIHVTAIGKYMGQTTMLGTYTVQVFPGAVTAISLRGRRPWQM